MEHGFMGHMGFHVGLAAAVTGMEKGITPERWTQEVFI